MLEISAPNTVVDHTPNAGEIRIEPSLQTTCNSIGIFDRVTEKGTPPEKVNRSSPCFWHVSCQPIAIYNVEKRARRIPMARSPANGSATGGLRKRPETFPAPPLRLDRTFPTRKSPLTMCWSVLPSGKTRSAWRCPPKWENTSSQRTNRIPMPSSRGKKRRFVLLAAFHICHTATPPTIHAGNRQANISRFAQSAREKKASDCISRFSRRISPEFDKHRHSTQRKLRTPPTRETVSAARPIRRSNPDR